MKYIVKYIKFKLYYHRLKLIIRIYNRCNNLKIKHFIIRRIESLLRKIEETKNEIF